MIRVAWLLAVGLGLLTACGQGTAQERPPAATPAAAPAGDLVTFDALCPPYQIYWRGAWWVARSPLAKSTGLGPERRLQGRIRETEPGLATVVSPGFNGEQVVERTGATRQDQPPRPPCTGF